MRICHINFAKDYRGGERQTELLIRELASAGHSQRLIVRRGQPLAARCADVPDLDVRQCANPLTAGVAARGTALVHAHDARAVYSAGIARLCFGIPFLLTRRVVKLQKRSWLRDRCYRAAAAVTAVSAAAAEIVRRSYPDLGVDVIGDACASLAADDAHIAELRQRYAGKRLIGHVGSYIDSVKGQLTIIEAARRAAIERPDWQFLLLGEGRDETLFREQCADLPNVELIGWVEDLGSYLSVLEVFVFPSRIEAFGSSVLDAMQYGLPVVASRVGGIPEFVSDGVNGRLIDSGDAAALFTAVAEILGDAALAERMAAANRSRAAEFSAAKMADRYAAIYRRIAD